MPVLWPQTFYFEYKAYRNNITTSYYTRKMRKHFFSLNIANQFKHHYEFYPQ